MGLIRRISPCVDRMDSCEGIKHRLHMGAEWGATMIQFIRGFTIRSMQSPCDEQRRLFA